MCEDIEKIISYQNSSEIFELIVAFESCTLPRERWTHPAYLTVVFWYLYVNPLPEARRLIRDGIKRYNFEHNIIKTVDSNNYEALTPMWVRIVNDYVKQHRDINSFINLANGLFQHITNEKREKNKKMKVTSPGRIFNAVAAARSNFDRAEFVRPTSYPVG